MDKLPELYVQYGFPGKDKLFKISNNLGLNLSKQQIDKFISQQDVNQKYAPDANKNYSLPITSFDYKVNCQIDLLDMSKFSFYNRVNGTKKWIFICVDIWSRKAWALPLASKHTTETVKALQHLIDDNYIPKILTSDDGGEWAGEFKKLMDKHNIHHQIYVKDHRALGIINNFSKRIKSILFKYFSSSDNQNLNWVSYLEKFMKTYNDTSHDGLCGDSPNGAIKHKFSTDMCHSKKIEKFNPTIPIEKGDYVRILLNKGTFDKGTSQKYGDVHTVVEKPDDIHFKLDNGKTYRYHEIKKVPKPVTAPEPKPVEPVDKPVEKPIDKPVDKIQEINKLEKFKRLERKNNAGIVNELGEIIPENWRLIPTNTTRRPNSRVTQLVMPKKT